MSWLSSLFTPSGYNADQNIYQQQQNDQSQINSLLAPEVGYQQELQQFRQSNLPAMESAVNNLLQFTTQSGRNNLVNYMGQQNQAAGADQAAGASSQWAGNAGLANAAKLSDMNQANTNTANYSDQINSPQAETQAYQSALSAMQSLNPSYSGAESIGSLQNQEPMVPQSGGAGAIAGLLGTLAGGGAFSGLLQKLTGGSSSSQNGQWTNYTGQSNSANPASATNPPLIAYNGNYVAGTGDYGPSQTPQQTATPAAAK